jgi:calcineurin-like phosphoesterase family protein
MNEALIREWNSVVGANDTVYHLGDVSILRPERTCEILERLNGKIFLVRGNHDKSAEHKLCNDRFEWIKDYYFLSLNGGVKIALMHYAMRIWDRRHYGSWHLFGHSHGKLQIPENEFAMDVGVDCWSFRPVSLEAIRRVMIERGWREKTTPVKNSQ